MSDLQSVSIWSDWQCDGGTNRAELARVTGCVERWDVDAGWRLSLTLAQSEPQLSEVTKRRVVRVELTDGTVREYRISEVRDQRTTGADVVEVTGNDPRIDLAERVMMSTTGSGGVVYYDDGRADLPPSDYIDLVVAQAVAAGLSVSRGTVTPTVLVSLDWSKATGLALLQQLVQAVRDTGTACELDFRRNGTTDYQIDLVTAIGASATAPELHVGRHVTQWSRRKSTDDQASRVLPFGAVDGTGYPATMAHAAWAITAKAGAVLTLEDPSGGAGPIQFTNQHADPKGSWYVQDIDGTLIQVTASSRTSLTQSSVTLASTPTAAVGDLIEFRADSSGTQLTTLTHPTYIQNPPTGYGEKLVPLERPALAGERNLFVNPWMDTWTTAASPPDGWGVGSATNSRLAAPSAYVNFGSYGWRLAGSFGSGSGRVGRVLTTETATVHVVTGEEFVTFSASMTVTALNNTDLWFRMTLGSGAVQDWYIQGANVPTGARLDVTIAGIQLPVGEQTVNFKVGAYVDATSAIGLTLDAVQLTQTPNAADAFFVQPRGNALWQAGNQYLNDWSDPPPEFSGNVLDYARLSPSTWASVAVNPGCTAHVIDDRRGVDTSVRAIGIEWNRLVAGDTKITWSTKPRSYVATSERRAMNASITQGPTPTAPTMGTGGTGTTPTPSATTGAGTLLVPFNVRGQQTLTNLPASETERTSDNEAYVWLAPYDYARLEAVVVTPASQGQLVAKYWDGSAWQYLDAVSGPVLSLTTAGTVKGTEVALDNGAKGDVIVGLFESGGNGTDDPVVGSVFLHCHTRSQALACTPRGTLTSYATTYGGDDFSTYATFADYFAAVGSSFPYANVADTTQGGTADGSNALYTGPYCQQAIRGYYNNSGVEGGPYLFKRLTNAAGTAQNPEEFWFRFEVSYDSAYGTLAGPDGNLLWTNYPVSGSGAPYYELRMVSGGNVFLRPFSYSGSWSAGSDVVLGSSSLLIGAGVRDIILRVTATGASQTTCDVWIEAPGSGSAKLATANATTTSGSADKRKTASVELWASVRATASTDIIDWHLWEWVPVSAASNPYSVTP